jgi:hypothetical protein
LIGKTALECARIILKEKGNQARHFSRIAKEAIRRGYKGRMEGPPEEVENRILHSFCAAMHRSEDFEGVGKGYHRLVKPDDQG